MSCKSLKGKGKKSGLRIIYVYERASNKVTFIEVYFKQNKKNEDTKRLSDFVKELKRH
jgi:hypothetical protein